MSTSAGFLYLLHAQYIDYELNSWMAVSFFFSKARS